MTRKLQILLPVFNEEKSIPKVLKEIHQEISKKVPFEFIITEDGSTDKTRDLLKKLKQKYPMVLITSVKRKGYANAVIDGMKKATASYILCLDSDGQCDPKDFLKVWKLRKKADIVIGWRTKRADNIQRKVLSGGFKLLYSSIFGVKIHDPSCPFILVKKEALKTIVKELGVLREGFWWEFIARATGRFTIAETPVKHRERIDGKTRVYSLDKLPNIAFTHVTGLYKIYKQKQNLSRSPAKSSN